METRKISVIVPAYNEEDVLDEFHARLSAVLDSLDLGSEILYVNDGSQDETLPVLERLKRQDPRVGIIDLSRNFGKEAALTAGIHRASGDAVVVIDADLQDPPELIPEFIRVWQEEGADVVYGQREAREGETWLKKVTAGAFYRLMQHFGKVKIPRDTGDFRLLDRCAIEALKQLPEQHRFMKGLFAWIGFNQKAVLYRRKPRQAGETKWNYWRLWNFAIEGFTSFTIMPLQVAIYIGLTTSVLSFLYGMFIMARTLVRGGDVAGYPSLVVIILFLGGVQLLFIGIIGEYLGRIFNETKQRPLYFERSYAPSSNATVSVAASTPLPTPASARQYAAAYQLRNLAAATRPITQPASGIPKRTTSKHRR